jgi:hypothetical protein
MAASNTEVGTAPRVLTPSRGIEMVELPVAAMRELQKITLSDSTEEECGG